MRFLILFGAGALALLLIIRLLNLQVRRRSDNRDNRSATSDGSDPIIEGSVVEPSARVSHDSKGKGQNNSDHAGPSSDSGGSDGGDGGGD